MADAKSETSKIPAEKRTAKSGKVYYQSQYDLSKDYDRENIDQVKLRVVKGGKSRLQEYVKTMHSAEPDNPKYRSLNSFIVSVLKEETDIEDL